MEKLCNSCLYIMTTELDNPGLWSNEMVEKAVERAGDVPCDVESTRSSRITWVYCAMLLGRLKCISANVGAGGESKCPNPWPGCQPERIFSGTGMTNLCVN